MDITEEWYENLVVYCAARHYNEGDVVDWHTCSRNGDELCNKSICPFYDRFREITKQYTLAIRELRKEM